VAQPPTLGNKPASPNKPLLLAFGMAVAACAGGGVALLAETFKPTIGSSGR
jgi:uncharacterized protein involved in exopolysaccharide biosynthesis